MADDNVRPMPFLANFGYPVKDERAAIRLTKTFIAKLKEMTQTQRVTAMAVLAESVCLGCGALHPSDTCPSCR